MPDRQSQEASIVVGVDGSHSSQAALRWAVRQGELTGSPVHAVLAWEMPAMLGSIGWVPGPVNMKEMESGARETLGNAIREALGDQGGVALRTTVAYGTAPAVLLDAARDASLLVVGNRGHGGFAEALLGSVGQHCTQHATCPVVVVRSAREAGGRG
ncbi:universal stress protein [Streptomyces sp. NPDC059740]|uniref:universal stress protein n=1 Tax=Streptomyces sp. NPDC059740 TaxID=3346926 RepID=UPI0036521008